MPTEQQILSEDAVREIEARYEKASVGPWEQRYIGPKGYTVWATAITRTGSMQVALFGHAEGFDQDNAEFTAHAREDVPALCRDWHALKAENERLRNQLETGPAWP